MEGERSGREVVAEFRRRRIETLYGMRYSLPLMLSSLGFFFLNGAVVQRDPWYLWAIAVVAALTFVGSLLHMWHVFGRFWRCPVCDDPLGDMEGVDLCPVVCRVCGARLAPSKRRR